MSTKTLVFFNHKGGVTKTTSSFIVGNLLGTDSHPKLKDEYVRVGEKVLFVDLDSQGNLTRALLKNEGDIEIKGGAIEAIDAVDATDYIIQIPSNQNLYLLPATKSLSLFADVVFENDLQSLDGYEKLLESALTPFVEKNDIQYVIIDNAPSTSKIMVQALNVSFGEKTSAIIPFQLNDFGNESLGDAASTIEGIQRDSNPNLEVIGLLPTLLQRTTKAYKAILNEARGVYDDLVFESVIFSKEGIVEMTSNGFKEEYAKQREVLEMYYKLLNEIKERI